MFKREMRRLEKERDADPIREARSDAWKKAAQKSGMTFAKLMVIANSAEIKERKRLGITAPMDKTKMATDVEHPNPSDARSIEHLPSEIRAARVVP